MLCTTILMIVSRFFALPGPGGLARSYVIHHRLWQQCEQLIQGLMFGSEKHVRKRRTLGTIQSLLLLSEWHPRSILLAPQCDMWHGIHPLNPPVGFFTDNSCHGVSNKHERLTRLRIRKLLYVYLTNMAVRLGFQNIFPQDIILTMSLVAPREFDNGGGESWDATVEHWLGLVRRGEVLLQCFSTLLRRQRATYGTVTTSYFSRTSKLHSRNGTMSLWHQRQVSSCFSLVTNNDGIAHLFSISIKSPEYS